MGKATWVILGGILGAASGSALAVGACRIICGFDEKGSRMFQLSMPLVCWAGIVLGIIGCTAGATWAADWVGNKESLQHENSHEKNYRE